MFKFFPQNNSMCYFPKHEPRKLFYCDGFKHFELDQVCHKWRYRHVFNFNTQLKRLTGKKAIVPI